MLYVVIRNLLKPARQYACHRSVATSSQPLRGVWTNSGFSEHYPTSAMGWCVSRHFRSGSDLSAVPWQKKEAAGNQAETPKVTEWSNASIADIRKNVSGYMSDDNLSRLKTYFRYPPDYNLEDLRCVSLTPKPAMTATLVGLFPLVMSAFIPGMGFVQLACGATIVSFAGGVQWGAAIAETKEICPEKTAAAVAPAVLSVVALTLPTALGFILISGGLAATAYYDAILGNYPGWYKALRVVATGGALVLMLIGFVNHVIFS